MENGMMETGNTPEERKTSLKEILTSAVLIGVISVFFILNIVIPAPDILESERRPRAKFPEFSIDAVLSGSFMSKFESYAADRFVFRDTFRGLHAFMILDVYRQSDKSGLYRDDTVGLGEFRRINENAFRQTSERIKKAADIFDGMDMNIYYSVVPDKSTFARRSMPGFDLDIAEAILFDVLGEYEYISLADKLIAEMFYRTDLHWDQRVIRAVSDHIISEMGGRAYDSAWHVTTAGEFRGVYAGQLALPVSADEMQYVDVLGSSEPVVRYLNDKTLEFDNGPLYDLNRFSGVDPYDLFLRGPQPLIILENKNAPERELYLFRDSFGSSLAPVLLDAYSKITVIDLRYIHLSLLEFFVEFTPGSDVLFIYSSQIFNNPTILQTN